MAKTTYWEDIEESAKELDIKDTSETNLRLRLLEKLKLEKQEDNATTRHTPTPSNCRTPPQ
jgi:hypothetical protein